MDGLLACRPGLAAIMHLGGSSAQPSEAAPAEARPSVQPADPQAVYCLAMGDCYTAATACGGGDFRQVALPGEAFPATSRSRAGTRRERGEGR